jgi:hypothetical protein
MRVDGSGGAVRLIDLGLWVVRCSLAVPTHGRAGPWPSDGDVFSPGLNWAGSCATPSGPDLGQWDMAIPARGGHPGTERCSCDAGVFRRR